MYFFAKPRRQIPIQILSPHSDFCETPLGKIEIPFHFSEMPKEFIETPLYERLDLQTFRQSRYYCRIKAKGI